MEKENADALEIAYGRRYKILLHLSEAPIICSSEIPKACRGKVEFNCPHSSLSLLWRCLIIWTGVDFGPPHPGTNSFCCSIARCVLWAFQLTDSWDVCTPGTMTNWIIISYSTFWCLSWFDMLLQYPQTPLSLFQVEKFFLACLTSTHVEVISHFLAILPLSSVHHIVYYVLPEVRNAPCTHSSRIIFQQPLHFSFWALS